MSTGQEGSLADAELAFMSLPSTEYQAEPAHASPPAPSVPLF